MNSSLEIFREEEKKENKILIYILFEMKELVLMLVLMLTIKSKFVYKNKRGFLLAINTVTSISWIYAN